MGLIGYACGEVVLALFNRLCPLRETSVFRLSQAPFEASVDDTDARNALRWPTIAVGWGGRPAHLRRRLEDVVVKAAAPGVTMRVPPMRRATAVWIAPIRPPSRLAHPSDPAYSAPMVSPFSATERFMSGTSRTSARASTANSQKTSK
jgi:hypothetical protein